VETVVVMAIIGILASIVLPVYNEVKLAAKKVKDVSNLKKIAEAWRECVVKPGGRMEEIHPDAVSEFTLLMAGERSKNKSDAVLNDPSVYFSPGDRFASNLQYTTLTYYDTSYGSWQMTKGKDGRDSNRDILEMTISYCLIYPLPATVPLDTTPLGFTRGLCTNGKWDEELGLYGSKGGYVVYCDGHVTWFDGDRQAKFLKWDRSGYTSDIRDAVPRKRENDLFNDFFTEITCGSDRIEMELKGRERGVILCDRGKGE
jgi:prepilin-type processing-associated H-X9-DG protein